ncbi:MAG: peptidase M50 [Gammaproteobacteria bacterium]|nr:peptidase M50 [Gammaproteobacteria bacterium]
MLRPKLRAHVELHRQPYGEGANYLLQDFSTGKIYRFNTPAYELIGRMDGVRTVAQIWEDATANPAGESDNDAPTQDELIEVLGQLHAADALQGSLTPDCVELFRRAERHRAQRWRKLLRSPLSLKIRLFDPEPWLDVLQPIARPVFSGVGLFIWVCVVTSALIAIGPHWTELTAYASAHALRADNLVVLAILYPLLKALHEFGHALAVKRWGGEVHEMGVTMMAFLPIPYVDASAASALRYKRQRVAVSAAGMMVELFVASVAAFVWLLVEPGVVRAAAFDTMLIASVSTLIFNGNPLLRFDAYYILEDVVEVPNLATRSTRYLTYLIQRYVLRVTDSISPASRPGERRWFVGYGLGSTVYRWFITITIIWFVAGEFFIIGVVLALWASFTQIVLPISKAVAFVVGDPRLAANRVRAVFLVSASIVMALSAIFLIPIPTWTKADGVLLPGENAHVKAGSDGFLYAVLAQPFADVSKGQPLVVVDTPFLQRNLEVLEAQRDEILARLLVARVDSFVEAKTVEDELSVVRAAISQAEINLGSQTVTSPTAGHFIPIDLDDPVGRYVKEGQLLGYVVSADNFALHVAIPHESAGRVHEGVDSVSVKFVDRPAITLPALVSRSVPAAQRHLPSSVLSTLGGGSIQIEPQEELGQTALGSVFIVEVALQGLPPQNCVGLRAHVRFGHEPESAGKQLYRAGRQLLLGRFGI